MSLRFTENNTSVLFSLSFVGHTYTFFQAWGHSSGFWFNYCTTVLLQPREQTVRDVRSRLASSETRTSARAVLFSLPSPAHPSPPIPSHLPLTWSPRPSQEVASHQLASGRCAGEGLCWRAADVWGAENRSRRVPQHTHQVSRAHRDHCPAVQLREDILGQVWTGPGRRQEAEKGGRRSYLSGDSGNGVAVVLWAC